MIESTVESDMEARDDEVSLSFRRSSVLNFKSVAQLSFHRVIVDTHHGSPYGN